ncbi:maleylacetoacetate isomerase [Pinisolibacter aquiterrae]|uniref:maleylacetoacetate isomerase n=1 Tax=Pinisolibacter aquiterrae TaxID=2815579 RepID=UPI001C3DB868|nr:maleylacetoacetate isomerase [Pinisolibacter aquiterrae]MBV5263839.1 maleylacetoacetate isomerase [Pinisolibacter aquiterrae]MCC8237341.1 maleylacetoacetate isomerase [Pinisolibacter aquiterrae]
MRLHGYFRSSAAWRLRIALALKGLAREDVFVHLRRGEQRAPAHLARNPQGLVPVLELDDGTMLTQSLAILDWLEETHPAPSILPEGAIERARARAFALAIACEIHPVQNLRVLNRLRREAGFDDAGVAAWARETNAEGLAACEALVADRPGGFLFAGRPTIAEICLVPQLGNARRFGVDVARFSRLLAAEAAALALPAFAEAAPERQPDAE